MRLMMTPQMKEMMTALSGIGKFGETYELLVNYPDSELLR